MVSFRDRRFLTNVKNSPHIDLSVNKFVLSVSVTGRAGGHMIPLSAPPTATGRACGYMRRAKLVAVHCCLKIVLISSCGRKANKKLVFVPPPVGPRFLVFWFFYHEYLCGYGYLKRYLEPKRSCNIPKQNRAQQTQDRYRDKCLLWEYKLMMPHPRNPAKTPEYQLSYSQRFDDAPPES